MSRKQGTPPCDHKVEKEDNFSKLAAVYYGDGSDVKAKKIQNANLNSEGEPLDPKSLQPGQILKIPA